MRATLTITGLYNWDNTIFDGWSFPNGIQKDDVASAIMYECSGLEITLPNPDIFKVVTNGWCQRKQHAWSRAYAAMLASYNPIHNYDRTETHTEAETGSSGQSVESSGTGTESTAAFNSSTYAPKSHVSNDQDSEASANYGRNALHTISASGNIGVTTSQQMVDDELNLSGKLDIYHLIAMDFKKEFCLAIYY